MPSITSIGNRDNNTSNRSEQLSNAALGSSPPIPSSLQTILDSGSSGHFFGINFPLHNVRPNPHPVSVELPNQDTIKSTHIGDLPLPLLPHEARIGHQFPEFGPTSLISLGLLCDHGCEAHFTAQTVTVTLNTSVILHSYRNPTTRGLWILDLPPSHVAMNAINHKASAEDLVAFAHRALFSPAISTLCRALSKGFLPPFPGLSPATLAKYPPRSAATIKGHLDNVRKNQRSQAPTNAWSVRAVDPTSNGSTTNALRLSRTSSRTNALTSNSSHRMIIVAMPPNVPFAPPRTTLSQAGVAWTMTSPCATGTRPSHKPN